MFDFQKLEIYHQAKMFHSMMREVILNHQPDKVLRDQLSRASTSVILNIAEGTGRFTNKDKRHFYIMSRGSLFECIAICDILKDEHHISQEKFDQISDEGEVLSKRIFGLIKYHS